MFFENTEELAQNKLLLLYIIDSSQNSLSNNELTEFVLQNNYMNYFLVQQYLSELIDSGFIEYKDNENKKIYFLLEKGKATLSYFEDRIPKATKENITVNFFNHESNNKTTKILGEYSKIKDNEYTVNLRLIEKNETLFNLYLSVATEKQAQKICEVWQNKTEYIYKNLLNMLADDEITSI